MQRSIRITSQITLACAALWLDVHAAQAQCRVSELSRLRVAKPPTASLFAAALALDGNVAIIGSWADEEQANCSGAAWIFSRQGTSWVCQQKLRPPGGVDFDYFGATVAVSGNVVVVGAPGEDVHGEGSGAAYVYRYADMAWSLEAKLSAGDAGDHFGSAVAIAGDALVIGAALDAVNGIASGSASVFRWNGVQWIEEAKLIPADGETDDWFGAKLALAGDTVAIGAPYSDGSGEKSGVVYIFRRSGVNWVREAKLLAGDAVAGDWFGAAVAIHGDVVLIGAPYRTADSGVSGAAYIFRRTGTTWAQERKLLAPDGAGHDFFGYSVAISSEIALVGATLDGEAGPSAGSAYVFRRAGTDWDCGAKLGPAQGMAYEFVGESVALSGDTALVGAAATDDGVSEVKLAYAFGGLDDCNGNSTLDICDVAAGASVDANANGIPDECELGDMNCDGRVTYGDINPFVLALQGPETYDAAYPDCDWSRADCNADGAVDSSDVIPFIRLFGRSR